MKFSIIIPVYNAQATLLDTLASIDAQTYKDFEVILTDDGSVDGSGHICDEYCAGHTGASVIHRSNAGALSARCAGAAAAVGDYLIFVDADDLLMPDALCILRDIIKDGKYDMIIYNAVMYDGKNDKIFFEHVLPQGQVRNKSLIYDKLFTSYSLNSMCIKAIDRRIFEELKDTDLSPFYDCKVAEDMLQSALVYKRAKNVYYLDKALYRYRVSQGASHSFDPDFYRSNLRINRYICDLLGGRDSIGTVEGEDAHAVQTVSDECNEDIKDIEEKSAVHLLIAAYAGISQMRYCKKTDETILKDISDDEAFRNSCEMILTKDSKCRQYLSRRQRYVLGLLKEGHFFIIKMLIGIKRIL